MSAEPSGETNPESANTPEESHPVPSKPSNDFNAEPSEPQKEMNSVEADLPEEAEHLSPEASKGLKAMPDKEPDKVKTRKAEPNDEIKARGAEVVADVKGHPADISFLTSVGQLPLAAAAVEQATALYAWAKAQNEYVKYGLEKGETITKDAAAALSSSTIVQSVATRLHTLDTAAGQRMEALKRSYPLINQPPEAIFQTTREQLSQFSPVADYAQVARQAEGLLKSQLQQNYDIARTKTNELVRTMQDQTHALVEYSKGLNLEQATSDIKKAYESAQDYVSSTLAGAQLTAKNQATAVKTTIESHVTAIQNSQVLVPLQQQLEGLKTQLDHLVASIKNSLTAQQLATVETLTSKVEDALKAWGPVKDHLLAYFVSQHDEPKPVVESSNSS